MESAHRPHQQRSQPDARIPLAELVQVPSRPEGESLQDHDTPQSRVLRQHLGPHHTKYIDKLESVQRRAAHFVTNQPHRRSEPVVSVTAMIQDLGWEPLSTRRLQSRLTSFYKVLNHHLEIPQSYHPVPAQDLQDTRGHEKRFQTYQPEIDAYKFSFFPRTVVDWNKLPAETVHAESTEAFKLRLCTSRE